MTGDVSQGIADFFSVSEQHRLSGQDYAVNAIVEAVMCSCKAIPAVTSIVLGALLCLFGFGCDGHLVSFRWLFY